MTGFITPQVLRDRARSQAVMLLREFPSSEAAVLGNIPPRYREIVQANQHRLAFYSYRAYKCYGRGVTTLGPLTTGPQSTPAGECPIHLTYTPRHQIKAGSNSSVPWANSLISPLARDKVDDYTPEQQAVIIVLDAVAAVIMVCSFEITPVDCYQRLHQ